MGTKQFSLKPKHLKILRRLPQGALTNQLNIFITKQNELAAAREWQNSQPISAWAQNFWQRGM